MNKIEHTLTELFDLQQFAIKLGLDNITKLSKYFDNPHLNYPTIHIAGTNGKGSTAIILQKILMLHGLKVGLFTSPHLVHFNERIRINDDLIPDEFIYDFWNKIKEFVLELKATFFDTTTCMAFEYFNQNNVDVAIFETGLGGRLDSTNIIDPEIALITPIDFDHNKQLGNTLSQIASEKAGIIKTNCSVFLAKQNPEVNKYFQNQFNSKNIIQFENQIKNLKINAQMDKTPFEFQDKLKNKKFTNLHLKLLGNHQAENACLAYLSAAQYLQDIKIDFNEKLFRKALLNVEWHGRIQKISSDPDIYIDVSHNEAGIEETVNFIQSNFKKSNLKLLIGLLEDKNYKKIVDLLKDSFSQVWITEPANHRKLSGEILQNEFAQAGISSEIIKDISESYESLINQLESEDTLFIMGSHYLAGTIESMNLQNNLT